MNEIFEEWDTYAKRKELKPRDVDTGGIITNADLKIVAVTGVRRSGKTSLLIIMRRRLEEAGEKSGYINLEDARMKSNREALDSALKWFGDSGYLLLDEITSVDGWEGWLARNHEMLKGKLRLIVSSSRQSLVRPAKPLRGRIMPYELYPLSFKEFLQFNDASVETTTAGMGKIERLLDEYLIYGGFPEVVLIKDKTDKSRTLGSYFRDIIGLDVAEIAAENVTTVELFGRYVIEAPYFSASKCLNFFKSAGHKIGKQSILDLERCSQEGYLFFFVPIFSRSIKDRSQYPRKAYMGDTGFMQAVSGKKDMGRLFENAVFLELKRRAKQSQEISYWKDRTGSEVDFVTREGLAPKEMIQVVYDLEDKKTAGREVRGLLSCAKEFGLKRGLVITRKVEKVESVSGVQIRFIPLWKWLLAAPKP